MNKITTLFAAVLVLMVSCSDETTVFSDPQDNIQLENSEQILENSIGYEYSGVLEIADEGNFSGKYSNSGKEEMAGDYPLTLVAQVSPPSYSGGENLTASHVHVDGDFAYVSYNTVDESYAGGVDIVDIGDPAQPRVSSRLYYSNADINSIEYSDGYVYAVGGVDAEKSVSATSNSFVAKIPCNNGKMDISAGITYGFQEGFNSTDIEVTANTVVVTSGGDGTITVYKKGDLTILNELVFQDLRSVAINNSQYAVLDAGTGVSILDDNLNIIKEIGIDTDFGTATKRTLDFGNDIIMVSEGSKGAGVYNASSGAFIEYIPILVDPSFSSDEGIETNAVAINENVILMANGGAGLCLSEDNGDNTNSVGIIELDGSINYVESKDDYIFAASGKNGLQVIKLNRPDDSLVNRCADLPFYSGSSRLYVNQGETKEYKGSKWFNNLNVNGSLLLCGSWTVSNDSYINTGGIFEMNGTFVIGRNYRRRNIVLSQDAILRIEGNLTVYGDLILNDGATLEFIGENSVVNVFGSVIKSGSAEVIGSFDDVRNKF